MVRLTSLVGQGGCACKIGPHLLASMLSQVEGVTNSDVLTDMTGSDDAGVYRIAPDMALVQTIDFFTPIVDDPYIFGTIAAANSLSDIYAMGGKPLTTMNVLAVPMVLMEEKQVERILNGAMAVVKQAGAVAIGGHSIENPIPVFGLSVTGVVNPRSIWKNSGAMVGDALILTKPIGTGIMSTALKGNLFTKGTEEAIHSMCTLNQTATEVMSHYTVHACTDITGFGLMGHAYEMAYNSSVSLQLRFSCIPLFSDVVKAARMGLVPAATYGNRKASSGIFIKNDMEPTWGDICFDPQTSGGLLIAIPRNEVDSCVKSLHQSGVIHAAYIGDVIKRQGKKLVIVE